MRDISFDNLTSHSVPDCSGEISILPQFSRPQSLFQARELAEQSPRAMAFNYPHHVTNRPSRRKRDQYVDMLSAYFRFDNFETIILAYLPDQLFRSFLNLLPLKYILPIFRAPHQVVARIVDRMTRPLKAHALYISYQRARAYADKGAFPVPLINPLGAACIPPRGKPRGILQRVS